MTGAPRSIADWLALAELSIPDIQEPTEQGITLTVAKVGVLAATRAAYEAAGIHDLQELRDVPPGGMTIALPTVTVETDAGPKLYRLPESLGDWAFSLVALANQGDKLFPGVGGVQPPTRAVHLQHRLCGDYRAQLMEGTGLR